MAALFGLLVFRQPPGLAVAPLRANFMPFQTILDYLGKSPSGGVALVNLAGNVLIFMPLGFFVPLVRRAAGWKTAVVVGALVSSGFEIAQAILRVGVYDIDDILLNAFGAVLGYWIFVGALKITAKPKAKPD